MTAPDTAPFKTHPLLLTLKTLWRKQLFSLVHILSLTLSLCVFFLICIYVQYEFSYDKFHRSYRRIFRVEGRLLLGDGETQPQAMTPLPLGPVLDQNFPSIEMAARISRLLGRTLLTVGEDRKFIEREGLWADASLFEIFSLTFIQGDPRTALRQARSIVLTQSLAARLFPEGSAVGKNVNINTLSDWTVTAVVADFPANSHLRFRFILSSDYGQSAASNWESSTVFTYILLKKKAARRDVEEKIRPILRERGGVLDKEVYLKPVSKIHLSSNVLFEFQKNGNKRTLHFFLGLGFSLLVLVSLGLIILSKPRLEGTFPSGLNVLETLALPLFSLLLALLLSVLLIERFGHFMHVNLKVQSWPFLMISILVALFVVFLFPLTSSFFLKKKGGEKSSVESAKGEKIPLFPDQLILGLQIFFLVTILITTFLVSRQVDHLKKGKVGIAKEDIMILNFKNLNADTVNRLGALKNELLKNPNILNAAFSFSVPFDIHGTSLVRTENMGEENRILVNVNFVNRDFLDTYELKIVDEAVFPSLKTQLASQEWVCFINESAAQRLGWTDLRNRGETLMGKRIVFDITNRPPIAAVFRDFPSSFWKDSAEPLVLVLNQRRTSVHPFFSVKYFSGDRINTVKFIENKFQILFPDDVFDSLNIEELYGRVYQDEAILLRALLIFSLLSLTIFFFIWLKQNYIWSPQKGGELLKAFIAANILAWPLAFLLLIGWLRKFAFRIELPLWIFLLSSLAVFVLYFVIHYVFRFRSFLPAVRWIVFYAAVLLIIKPHFIYSGFGRILELPVFSADKMFLWESFFQVGGLAELLSGFLSQFFFYSALGALIITFLAWAMSRLLKTLVKESGGGDSQILCFIPALLLFMIYNRYGHPLELSLAMLSALLFSVLFIKIGASRLYLRLLLFALLSALLYFISGGATLLFTLLVVLVEGIGRKRLLDTAGFLFAGTSVPFILGGIVFGLAPGDIYLRLLPFHADEVSKNTVLLAQLLFLSFPVVVVLLAFWHSRGRENMSFFQKRPVSRDKEKKERKVLQILDREYLKSCIPACVLLFLFLIASLSSFDREQRMSYKFLDYAQKNRWSDILELAGKIPPDIYDVFTNYEINRALYFTGRLKEDMFSFQQGLEAFVLTSSDQESYAAIDFAISDIALELGALNVSEHLDLEQMEMVGESPLILWKLGVINLAKGQVETARVFLNALKKDWLYGRQASRLLGHLEEDPELDHERQIRYLRAVFLTEDYANIDEETMLLELLKKRRYNQMAFEYLMALYMMERNVEKVVENIDRLRDFGFREIPVLYEEAILLYENKTEQKVDLKGRRIRPETVERFNRFTEIISSPARQADEFAASEFVQEFGQSYFFYYVFDTSGMDR